jgi:uncharacterized protein (TIGR02246 family)
MTETAIWAAERDCTRLILGYCQAADTNDIEAFAGLFTEDAEWVRPDGSTVTGQEAIRAYFAARPAGVVSAHISTNALVEVTGPDSATGRSVTTVYRGSALEDGPAVLASPAAILENRDDFTLTGQGWRIRRRRSRIIFAN